ncbi:MAG: glycoside hydrolase, partial [Gemmatimonadota bacterium]|nr:glycoside hydrolase [Gemmatimonadota bacterium]
ASTDTQVWVSSDDGDHWQSLKLDMPSVSVRDIQLKDDSTCMCSDLVAATHGRGFWILDDVTPLRQLAEAKASGAAYLYRPEPATRVRFATNDPTPWPPEVPAGENPPRGGIIDYYLAGNVAGPVTLDVLDAAGKVVRSYSSKDPVPNPDPATDPVAYNRLCQNNPAAPDCTLPLYWPAPPMVISTKEGMHRMSWDLRFDPVATNAGGGEGGEGAVPHRTYDDVNAPWAPAGNYTVRLTVDGKSYTQPLLLRLDPRVTTPPAALAQVATLSREMYDGSKRSHTEYLQARSLVSELEKLKGTDVDAFRAQVESLAPAPVTGGRGFGRRGGAAAASANLSSVTSTLTASAMAMQGADVAPTAGEIDAVERARTQLNDVMSRWNAVKTTGLAAFNAKRKAAGEPQVKLPN